MAKEAHLHPGDLLDRIQEQVDACDDIYFHADGAKGRFDIGDGTIRVRVKAGEHKRIRGVAGKGGRAATPVVAGTSPRTVKLEDPGVDVGIFSVRLEGGSLEIDNLRMEHTFAEGRKTPGTATLSVLVDNALPGRFSVTGCTIDTFAQAAVSIRSGTLDAGGEVVPHDVEIRDCVITGHGKPDSAVNYSCVNLGSGANQPVGMRGSRFEVSGCTLEPVLFAGVALLHFDSDSASHFVVADNAIGGPPNSVSHGVWVGNEDARMDGRPHPCHPRGTVEIARNRIVVGRVHPVSGSCAGIQVQAAISDPTLSLWTLIRGNDIHLPLGLGQEAKEVDGVVYEDQHESPDETGSLNTTALVEHNKIYNSRFVASQSPRLPMRGIRLEGHAHHVQVRENDLLGLGVSQGHVTLSPLASNNLVLGNAIGRMSHASPQSAGVICLGDANMILENDFRSCGAPGWTAPGEGGPGCIHLGQFSEGNHVRIGKGELPKGTTAAQQAWNEGKRNRVVDATAQPVSHGAPAPVRS